MLLLATMLGVAACGSGDETGVSARTPTASPAGSATPVEVQPVRIFDADPAGNETAPGEDSIAPDFEISDLGGSRHRLSDFRGTPVYVNFWTTWSVPSRTELPAINELLRRHGNELVVIAVNRAESAWLAAKFLDDFEVDFTVDGLDPEDTLYELYGGFGMPYSVFIDVEGQIARMFNGPVDEEAMALAYEESLSGEHEPLDLRVHSDKGQYVGIGDVQQYMILGEALNNSDSRVTSLVITAELFGRAGKLLETVSGYVCNGELSHGETTLFMFVIPDPSGKILDYSVRVDGVIAGANRPRELAVSSVSPSERSVSGLTMLETTGYVTNRSEAPASVNVCCAFRDFAGKIMAARFRREYAEPVVISPGQSQEFYCSPAGDIEPDRIAKAEMWVDFEDGGP